MSTETIAHFERKNINICYIFKNELCLCFIKNAGNKKNPRNRKVSGKSVISVFIKNQSAKTTDFAYFAIFGAYLSAFCFNSANCTIQNASSVL